MLTFTPIDYGLTFFVEHYFSLAISEKLLIFQMIIGLHISSLQRFSLSFQTKVKAITYFFAFLLLISFLNRFPVSYPRNDNRPFRDCFWGFALGIIGLGTILSVFFIHKKNSSSQKISSSTTQILNRLQTEEWKGWMQIAFLLYHYFRENRVYNMIRVFVSAYVFLTGMGNFIFFTTKKDFSLKRIILMLLRINILPAFLSFVTGAGLFTDYYIAPLHSYWFLKCYCICWFAEFFLQQKWSKIGSFQAQGIALILAIIGSVFIWEIMPRYVNFDDVERTLNILKLPKWFGVVLKESTFRFGLERYTGFVGMLFAWGLLPILQKCLNEEKGIKASNFVSFGVIIFTVGVCLLAFWFYHFSTLEKYAYNAWHPYIATLPILGYILMRNCHHRLRIFSFTFFEIAGQLSLELYVLQFHCFLCKNVLHVPVFFQTDMNTKPELSALILNCIVSGCLLVGFSSIGRRLTLELQQHCDESLRYFKSSWGCGVAVGSTVENKKDT